MIWLQFLVVLSAIFWGARLGGIGLGVMGGLGLAVLVFAFGLSPTGAPIDVMLMIVAVMMAASALEVAGGLEYLVYLAERLLRNNPQHINFLGPIVAFVFTLLSGTGHVCYSILPIIAEVARETGIRPERPLSVAVIASQQGITASPVSAATIALLSILGSTPIGLEHILSVSLPSTFAGIMSAALVMRKYGRELKDDPIYLRRLKDPKSRDSLLKMSTKNATVQAKISIVIFFGAVVMVVLFGIFPELRGHTSPKGERVDLAMSQMIEITMMSASALIIVICKVQVEKIPSSSIFKAGMQAVIAIFGIAWLGDTFFAANIDLLQGSVKSWVTAAPWTFGIALFGLSILLFSQAATVRALMPFGLALGIPPSLLVALFPAVNGYFVIPNYPTVVAAVQFDNTGTTRIGKYVLNHSFMLPGLVATGVSICTGLILVHLFF